MAKIEGSEAEADGPPISQLERFDDAPGSRIRRLEAMGNDDVAPLSDTDPIIRHGNWIGFGLVAVAVLGFLAVMALVR